MRLIPYWFGNVGVVGEGVDGLYSCGDGLGATRNKGGVAVLSLGEDGRLGHVVRDGEVLDEADNADPASEIED
jgi:hypothetical protein